jgi:serine/threonine-protein kinase
MSDVFISYKAEDRRRIQPLVQALQADGYSVWWDEHIGTGDEWRQTIEKQLDSARCVVVTWSKGSVGPEGHFVRDEASRAQRRHVYVPVLIDAVEPPLGFGESQATSLKGWKGDRFDGRYQAVLAAVNRIAGAGSSAANAAPVKSAGVSRRAVVAGGVAGTVAIAGAGAWALLRSGSAEASNSIAVLPFQNLSGDPGQAYFSDGVAEEIRSALARIAGLQVAGSTSSEAVRNDDAETAARKLAVANILTGSVRQSPSTIRVTAELIDGRSGLDKWSQSYDRNPGDAIKIQTDIAENVANALSATLGRAVRAAMTVGGTSNAAAQKLYLKAKAQLHSDDRENSLRTAIGLLDAAIALDPKFADGYALKAHAMSDLNGFYTAAGAGFAPGFVQAASVAQQAISIAPDLAAGHLTLAEIRKWQLDVGAAAVEYQKGHSLAGGDVDDLLAYTGFLWMMGRTDEAIDAAREAEARDPLNPATYSAEGSAQSSAERFAQAESAYRKALNLAPNLSLPRGRLGATLVEMGKFDEAEAEFRKLPPDNLFRLIGEAILFWRQGNRAASDAALLHAERSNGDDAHYQYAEVHAQRGEKDEAFASLDRAWSFHDPGLAIMKADRYLIPLRGDPRFAALLKKMNFPS